EKECVLKDGANNVTATDEVKPTSRNVGAGGYEIEVKLPSSPFLAPPGFYLLFVVHEEIPSQGVWIQLV
ncbi:galactose oxidase, partial [Trifolium pratense]